MENLKNILFDTMGINKDCETFVICGAVKGYTKNDGSYVKGVEDYITNGDINGAKTVAKRRIGTKLYTFEKAIGSVKNNFCSRVGLWIPKGFIVIDCDTEKDSEIVLNYIEENGIETPVISTPKGVHIIFKYEGDLKQTVKTLTHLGANVDYRTAEHGYIVLPYNDMDRTILKASNSVCGLPSILLPKEQQKGVKEPKNNLKIDSKANKTIVEGSRNDTLFKKLCGFVASPVFRNEGTLLPLAIGFNELYCEPKLDEEELKAIVYNVINNYQPEEFIFDNGKTSRVLENKLADIIATDYKYKQYMKSDFIYNGKCYTKLEDVEDLQKIVKGYIERTGNDNLVKTKTIDEVVKQLRIDHTVSRTHSSKFISVDNGLINLHTLEVIPHTDEVFTLFSIPCEFNGIKTSMDKFESSRFNEYLTTTFKGDKEVIANIQEVFGASLMPNPEKFAKFVVLSGEGSNGKSLFLNILRALHGQIYSTVAWKDIDGNRFALKNMVGKNINIDADASGTRIEETSNFKKIVTGDPVSLEEKGKQAKEGILDVMMVVSVNSLPSTADKSDGFFRRMAIIPFEQQFAPKDELKDKPNAIAIDYSLGSDIINNEMDIVLAFALEGLQRMLKNNYKMTKSEAVERATKEYKMNNNSVLAWLEHNKDGRYKCEVPAKMLFESYEDWCDNNGHSPMSTHTFGKLLSKTFTKKRTRNGFSYVDVISHKPLSDNYVEIAEELPF